MIIDAHQHFWNYNSKEYEWISDDILRKDFLPTNLKPLIKEAGVDGTIAVQARQSISETNYLLQISETNEFVKGVVGWLPIKSLKFISFLETVVNHDKFVGLRHVIQDESGSEFILSKEFNKGIESLKYFGITYDILIYEHQLSDTILFVDRHPNQIFILNHIAKPKMCGNINIWAKNLAELAERDNVYCKLSGMVTEFNHNNWTIKQLNPYFETCLNVFGTNRLMFGSDWPVCLLKVSYKEWLEIVREFISKLSSDEQSCILHKNATNVYNLKI
jgi:L-fuconolactonase